MSLTDINYYKLRLNDDNITEPNIYDDTVITIEKTVKNVELGFTEIGKNLNSVKNKIDEDIDKIDKLLRSNEIVSNVYLTIEELNKTIEESYEITINKLGIK